MDTHLRSLCSSSSCRSCDESLDDRPFDLMCCVHYDGLVADNCYPDSANGETTNPSTDDSEDS